MAQPMEVDFMVDVGDAESGQQIAVAAQALGYRTKVVLEPVEEEEDDQERFAVYCTRDMILTYEAVLAAQTELDRVSEPFGGRSDGWGTSGNAPSPE